MSFLLTDSLVHLDKNLRSSSKFFFSYFNTKVGNICLTGIYFLVRECLTIQIMVSNPGGDMDVQGVFKKRSNFCYKDFILQHFKHCPLQSSPLY
jgi:hypothetical protein